MIEQFLDFCALYPLARWVRDFSKGFDVNALRWRDEFEAEEHTGVALLQREKRLAQVRIEILAAGRKERRKQQSRPSKELHEIDEELHEVRRLYCAHQVKIRKLLSSRIDTADTREVMIDRKIHYSMITGHDKPYVWLKGQEDCAVSGGCCGRECGCCEKSLKMISYFSDLDLCGVASKRRVGLYGHCTSECGCCIEHIGAYEPHPLFTKPAPIQKPEMEEQPVKGLIWLLSSRGT